MFGYMGKILYVNLTDGTVTNKEIDQKIAQDYIGGGGYASKIVYDEVPAKADALGPDNRLVFMTGPVTGTRFPTSGRFAVAAKSPLTGILVTATSSGFFGVELKKTGHDGIVFHGKSEKPVYLQIIDDKIEIKDAADLWGIDSFAVQEMLIEKSGEKKARVACIGTAGEEMAPIACVMNDEGRAAGRGGVGAVMGSKNLKAIVVKGSNKINVAAPDFFNAMAKEISTGISGDVFAQFFSKWGTGMAMDMGWASGDVPVKNWQVGDWEEGCKKLGGEELRKTILKPHSAACHNCPIRCARWVEVPEGKYSFEGPGPEYETLGACGSMLLIDDINAVSWIGHLCNMYGMDTISTGATIAWAIEAYEKGHLTNEDTGGIELKWGDADTVIKVVELMGKKEGLGALLAQGSKKAAEIIGKGSGEYAIHVKGLEAPMHDPRAFHSLAVNYATGPRGACHVQGGSYFAEMGMILTEAGITHKQGRFDKKKKGLAAKVLQDMASIHNSLAVCAFAALGLQPSHVAMLMTLCTGMPYDKVSIMAVGERIINIQRAFACREGITRKDDTLPKRLLTALPDGGAAGKAADLEYQLEEYYGLRGWDENGIPTREKLQGLGLEETVKDLYA